MPTLRHTTNILFLKAFYNNRICNNREVLKTVKKTDTFFFLVQVTNLNQLRAVPAPKRDKKTRGRDLMAVEDHLQIQLIKEKKGRSL